MAEAKSKATEKSESALRREAVAAAERRLREAHREEFDGLVQQEAANRGVTYQRRLTDEEKALQKLRQLLNDHPGLADQVAAPAQPGVETAQPA
jgi:cellobiose-specific phosphotransferase system component IIA